MKLGYTVACLASGLVGGLVSLLLADLVVGQARPEVLEELNVKRINVLEEDGRRALVLANSENLPGSLIDGEEQAPRRGVPGIIFYNNLGDEIGGLIYPARERESGYDGGVQLSMDQIKQTGQAIALRHWRSDDYVRSAMEITDYATDKFAGDADNDPDVVAVLERLDAAETDEEEERIWSREYLPLLGEEGYLAHRVFLGSEGAERRQALRIRLLVDQNDEPSIQILDENGDVASAL